MADNVDITPGAGATIATDDVGGRHVQLLKPMFGDDGSATMVSAASPLPVTASLLATGTRTSTGDLVTADLAGFGGLIVSVQGTFSATMVFEGSNDGVTWSAVTGAAQVGFATPYGSLSTASFTSSGIFSLPAVARYYRIRVTAYTSGTPVGTIRGLIAPLHQMVYVGGGSMSVTATPTSQSSPTDGAGPQNAAYSNNQMLLYSGNGAWELARVPTRRVTAAVTASGNTAVWNPGAGTRYRLMRFKIDVTGDATISGGGILTMDLQDATTSIGATQSCYVPATAANTMAGWSSGWIDLGHGYRGAADANVLNLNLSSALTSGVCRIVVAGTTGTGTSGASA